MTHVNALYCYCYEHVYQSYICYPQQISTSRKGQIGVATDSNTNPTAVIFSNTKVWTF